MTKPPSTTTAELRQAMLDTMEAHLEALAEYRRARQRWLDGDRGQLGPEAEWCAAATERERATGRAREAALAVYTERRLTEALKQAPTGP